MASTMGEAWIITTVAGTGIAGFAGDGGPAERAVDDDAEGAARIVMQDQDDRVIETRVAHAA